MDLQLIKTALIVVTVVAGIAVVVGTPLISHFQKRIDAGQETTYRQRLDQQLTQSREEARSLEDEAKAERERLSTQLAEVRDRLRPFEEVATSRYPDDTIDEALRRLGDDIEDVRELATRDTPKPPSEAVIAATMEGTTGVKTRNPSLRVALNLGLSGFPNAILGPFGVLRG